MHAHYVTVVRPDLARYVALSFGWRFDTAHDRIYLELESSRPVEEQ
ncbi:hypothetical protein LV564_07120 [Komagataeibacter nataicola]|nr:hypothetical protein [Komagataeibacter nataicola]WEQ56836.1 hypothetical protein LV564_07120 [Komagataeibacter nataicola]WNM08303.1 hypothetical protein RI056_15700 [Komagataeibacter nataicola]